MSAIVDTHEEAAALELAPLLVRAAARGVPRRARARARAAIEAEPVGEGHSNITYLISRGASELVLRRPPRPPLPPSRPRRAARGAAADARSRTPTSRTPRGARHLRRRVGDRRALLRDGEGRGRRDHDRGPAARSTRRPSARRIGRGADRRARRDPRRRLAGLRAGGLRQADRLPGAPAPPLRRPVGAQQDARAAALDERRRRGSRPTCPSPARRRSSTATTGSATRCSRPARPRGWSRSSTGSWRRSATRSPTSAT